MRVADHGAIVAFNSAAAEIERHEEIIIITLMDYEGSFDRLPIRGQSGRRGRGIFPVATSSRRILMPLQKLPKLSQGVPVESKTMLGSIALKSSLARDFRTRPSST